jgi:hypothetical protein
MPKIPQSIVKVILLYAGLFSSFWAAAQVDYLVWSELSVWAPGRPDKFRQFYFRQDGKGQFVETLNERVIRIADVNDNSFVKPLELSQLFDLSDSYELPKVSGQVVEGRGNKVALVSSWNGRTKFITADANFLPPLMAGYREKMIEPSVVATGSFVSVRLLPTSFKLSSAEVDQLPLMSDDLVDQFSELRDAFATPFKFIVMDEARWRLVQSHLNQDSLGVYVRTTQRGVVKVQFYP